MNPYADIYLRLAEVEARRMQAFATVVATRHHMLTALEGMTKASGDLEVYMAAAKHHGGATSDLKYLKDMHYV